MGCVDGQLFTCTGTFGETGNIADPGDEIFRILISSMSCIPVKKSIHILVPGSPGLLPGLR